MAAVWNPTEPVRTLLASGGLTKETEVSFCLRRCVCVCVCVRGVLLSQAAIINGVVGHTFDELLGFVVASSLASLATEVRGSECVGGGGGGGGGGGVGHPPHPPPLMSE